MIPTQMTPRSARTERALRRVVHQFNQLLPGVQMSDFRYSATENAGILSGLRRLGLVTQFDRQNFATMTGRSNSIIRSLRTMVDRRRRQAYLLLRRVLPVDLARQIIRMMTRPDMYHALFVLPVYGPSNAIID
jgi:hypothetical protein